MSNEIENEIVSMQFNNKQFESGVSTSLGTIDKLKSSLAFPDAGKGLADVNTAVSRFNMNPMSSAIQGVSKLWLGLTTVAVTAISNITNKVVDAGLNLAKSFTIDPITQGFQEYEKNLNSIQTIMANTGKKVGVVNQYLNDLNHYSDQTIYNFGQMADSIGKFTAAGVPLKEATSSIKGLANTAALSGSDVNQLNTAMYQMSQALSTGTIRLMDWNSLANAGMGGENIRKALKATERTFDDQGAAMDDAITKFGSFRDSLQSGWLDAETFNKTMKVMAGQTTKSGKTIAFSVEQLQGMGYSLQAAKDLNKLSAAAINSATKVKTFTQLIDVVKESIGSGWSKIFQDLFGNFNEATKLWTGVSNTITGAVGRIFNSIDKVLVGWRNLGGYQDLWTGIMNIFKIMGNLIHPFVAAFQSILPSTGKAGSGLAKVTKGFADFTGFLVKVTDVIGDFTPNLSFIGKIFGFLASTGKRAISALQPLLPVLHLLSSYVGDLFDQGKSMAGNLIAGWIEGLDPAALQAAVVELANNIVTWIKDTLGIHSPASTMIPIGENIIQGIVQGLIAGAQFIIKALQKIFTGVGQALKYIVQNISWSDVLDTINTGLFLGVVLLFRKFVRTFRGIVDSWKEVMGSAGGVLDQLTSNLKTMQNQVRSEIIRNIAISIGILAVSALLLSTIDGKKLGVALGAITGMMVALIGAMKTLAGGSAKDMSGKQIAKTSGQLIALGTAMIAFSTAILILTGAVAIMGQMDPDTIKKGLAGVAGVIAMITAATAILSKTGGGATILATATALLIMSAALTAFVGVMKLYEQLDWQTLIRGGGAAAAVILAVGLAMRGFGKGAIGGATGLIIASAALVILAKAMQMFASIGLGDMIKAVVALDVILASLTGAAMAMSLAEGGATGMIIMAGAIIILAKALQIVAKIPFMDLVKAIGALALVVGLMAGAAILLAPAIPVMTGFGVALALIGGAIFLAGAGILAFATAMGILAVVGPAAFQALSDGIHNMIDLMPQIGEAIGGFLVSILTGVVKAAGPLATAIGKLLGILIDEIKKLLPKLGDLVQKLVKVVLRVIVNNQVNAAKAMIKFVLGMLNAMRKGIPKLIQAGTDMIIAVIKGLSKNAVKIANATGKAILDFLKGLHKAILKYEPKIIAEGIEIGKDIVRGAIQGVKDAAPDFFGSVKSMADKGLEYVKKPWKIFSPSHVTREYGRFFTLGAAQGIKDKQDQVSNEARDVANKALNAMKMTFRNSRNAANGIMDVNPKITPVLDLTQLERDASKIGGAMGHPTITADVSRRQARDIASEQAAHRGRGDDDRGGDTYNFNQTLNSPKPINHVRAYRGTKSQIALFKEVTGK